MRLWRDVRQADKSKGPTGRSGKQWLLGFIVFLLVVSSAALVAGSAGAEPTESPIGSVPPFEGSEPPNGPSGTEIRSLLDEAHEKEEERNEWLQSPAAVEEREQSQNAFAGIDAAAAEELLTAKFPEQLAALNSDSVRELSDAHLDRPLGEGAAVVSDEGKTALLEGSYPVQAENEEGELEKVDLDLEQTEEGFKPENPIVELSIPEAPEEGIVIGEEEAIVPRPQIVVTQDGAEQTEGRLFGDKNVFYNEVEPGSDMDMMVSPTAAGVEFFDILRSPASPETLRYQVELPPGTHLTEDGGGAKVLGADGTELYVIPAPTATDGQGSKVPTTLSVAGDTIIVDIPHQGPEIAYPILLDPEVYEQWNWNGALPGIPPWQPYYSAEGNGISLGTEDNFFPQWHGIFFAAQPGYLSPGAWSELILPPRNNYTYFSHATIDTFWRADQCSPLVQDPYDYDGMYVYQEAGTPVSAHWNGENINDAYWKGNSNIASWGNEIVVGYGKSVGGSNACWRNLMDADMSIWTEDWAAPSYSATVPSETKWLPKNEEPRTIQVSATDLGLGVKNVRMFGLGTQNYWWNHPECTGTYENPCPTSESGEIHFTTAGFPREGEVGYTVEVESPTQRRWDNREYKLHVDGEAPNIELGGELANVTAEAGATETNQSQGHDNLTLPVYNLKVTATDGTPASPRSGVKEVRLYMNHKLITSKAGSCSTNRCNEKLEWTYPLNLAEFGEGEHTLEIAAVDFVGNERKPEQRKIEFAYHPATGMKEEYVLQHFVLPDGKSHEGGGYEGPELTVNVTDGNLTFHQRDLDMHAEAAPLELERFYNDQQPTTKDGQWGKGWSLAQTPELTPQPGEAVPKRGSITRTSAVTSAVSLPVAQAESTFDQKLHARISKSSSGGYMVAYPGQEETAVFSAAGRLEEVRLGSTAEHASTTEEDPAVPLGPSYSSSFGAAGTATGKFTHPAGIAITPAGNLWVVDQGNDRVEEFTKAGAFVTSFGAPGEGAGQFSRPTDVAIDAKGNLWVTDAGTSRIEEFSEAGVFIKSIGSSGTGSGQFHSAEAIAIGNGHIWVGDTYNARIVELNEAGEVLSTFGTRGSAAGQLIEPTGIAIGTGNKVWVADWGNNRVSEYSESGEFIRQFGSEGSAAGQFQRPDVITVDSKGDVWVGDQNNERIQEFTQSGGYVTRFGAAGSGNGQFSLGWPMGIVTDSAGDLWVADTGNNRVQKWTIPNYGATYRGTIGTAGSGNGQLSHPAGIAVDGGGSLWVADQHNNRVEEFNQLGEFVLSVGSSGTAAGKLSSPRAVAIDQLGNLWVVDSGNGRVEEFSRTGAYVRTVGAPGTGPGQLSTAEGVAVDGEGEVWVADTYNHRLEEFGQGGELLRTVAPESGIPGHMVEPTSVAVDGNGNVWTTDWNRDRVIEFSGEGEFIREFGEAGSLGGQLLHPDAVALDASGNVWVTDEGNGRVEEFERNGHFLSQFGAAGSGAGQFHFEWPTGIAVTPSGQIDVADSGNNRVETWTPPQPGGSAPGPVAVEPYSAAPAVKYHYSGSNLASMGLQQPRTPSSEPTMSLSTTEGLTRTASVGSAQTASYAYTSGTMTAASSPEGETKYTYNPTTHLLTEVKLPNGTYATIAYDSYSRVTQVLVHPAGGTSKTTHFSYEAENETTHQPRRTIVFGTEVQETTYFIGADGSVFEWKLGETTPTLEAQSGGVWTAKNSTTPLEIGHDQTLFATAYSQNEIASIRVIANGTTLVEEETCADPSEPPKHNCDHVFLKWVMNPSEFQPGRLNLEVIATAFNPKQQYAEDFFITIPQPPPPTPGASEKPTFKKIVHFREEFGLDRNHPLSKAEQTELCLELLYEFERGEPAAVKATELWGVPMRQPEITEMEEREQWTNQAAQVLPEWAEEHASSTYGGFYVNEREGSKIYVGFTANQAAEVESLKNSGVLIAPSTQIVPFATPPTRTVTSVEASEENVIAAIEGNAPVSAATTGVEFNPEANRVEVASTNPSLVQEFITSTFGASAPIHVYGEPSEAILTLGRFQLGGPVLGGLALFGPSAGALCTSGFGAYAPGNGPPIRGVIPDLHFVLTAGHCFNKGESVVRLTALEGAEAETIGKVKRRSWVEPSVEEPQVDSEAISLLNESERSHSVFVGNPNAGYPMYGVTAPKVGMHVCFSGVISGVSCGVIKRRRYVPHVRGAGSRRFWGALVTAETAEGDSGSPVWEKETHQEVGSLSLGMPTPDQPCHIVIRRGTETSLCPRMLFAPLLPFRGKQHPEGIMEKLGVSMVLK